MRNRKHVIFFISLFLLLPTFSNSESSSLKNYRQLTTNWQELAKADALIQAEFLRNLEQMGYGDKLVKIQLDTPEGNVVPSIKKKGFAKPLSGMVVTHSVDGEVGKNNDLKKYLSEGYDAIGVSKDGKIFIRGSSFLRTEEPFVPNQTAINVTFDVNAVKGEKLTEEQIRVSKSIAIALQKAFLKYQTDVRVLFVDHHDKGLKPSKNYFEAGPARDAANEILKKQFGSRFQNSSGDSSPPKQGHN